MGKARQQKKTQSSPTSISENSQKIKKHEPVQMDDFPFELPKIIQLQKEKGSYKLIELIADDGGQAVIYKAQKILKNQKIYALKLFVDQPNKKYLESIEKSIPRNKNLLKYYDVGYYNNYLVNVTELCDRDLYKEIYDNNQQDKSIVDREIMAIEIIKQIANGYFSLLNYGIIHRDLKPENILIKDGIYKISDFGFAAYTKDISKTNVGTIGYQSPEIQQSKTYTSKCDVYSLGIVFYEMIFRELPFPENRNRNESDVITLPANSISEEAKEFIQKCLEFDDKYRLSWIQVYNHKIFKGFFNNIVKQLEMIEELKKDHFAQICDGDLQKEINENDQSFQFFDEREGIAIDIFKQILNEYFTQLNKGIIHGDLRPGNTLIKDGVYKISDFRFATQETSGTNDGTSCYKSPQILLNKNHTSKCDIYSLGIIFYELIFRKSPFPKKENIRDVQVVTFPDDNISREVKEFIVKCTEIKEEYRLSWIEVYNHKIFQGFFKNIVKQLEMIEELNQLKQDVLQIIRNNYSQHLISIQQIKLEEFLKYFNNSHFTRSQLSLVFCMLLQGEKQITGTEILDNQKTEFSREKMAHDGHVACLLTIYTRLIYQPNDSQFFNREKISFNQYFKFLKDIDPTIDKNDVEYSFNILKEEDVIKTSSFNQLLKFNFLENAGQRK